MNGTPSRNGAIRELEDQLGRMNLDLTGMTAGAVPVKKLTVNLNHATLVSSNLTAKEITQCLSSFAKAFSQR